MGLNHFFKKLFISPKDGISRSGEKPITDEEIPQLIQSSLEKTLRLEDEHKAGLRDIFKDHDLSEMEKEFFSALVLALEENKLNPALLRLERIGGGTINVSYVPLCFVGKINLRIIPDKYAVMKEGHRRALRVFGTIEEANTYMSEKGGDRVEVRPGENRHYMQYSRGLQSIKHLNNPTLQECIDTIPRWIAFIKYCKRTP